MEVPNLAPDGWSRPKRIAFRFAAIYFVLYLFPFPLDGFQFLQWLTTPYQNFWYSAIPWVGKHVLRLETDITVFPNGSGDTTFNYLQVLCYYAAAALLTLLWSLVDRKRPAYPRLYDWLRIYVRYGLALVMIGYGLAKVVKTQFPFPSPDRLMQPIGEASPMGLLWTFMGYSTAYTMFAGLAECVGGLLLFLRRTTTLGALIVMGVMTNVVIMNFSYDVPVKLYSMHLLLMAVFLALPDFKRLANVLVLNRPAGPAPLGRPFANRWLNRIALVAKVIFIGFNLFEATRGSIANWYAWGGGAPLPALYGVYEVETHTSDSELLQPLITEKNRWRRVAFNRNGGCTIQLMDGSRRRFRVNVRPDAKQMELTSFVDAPATFTLDYSEPAADRLSLSGTIDGAAVQAELCKAPQGAFLLVDRGFHWINEYPFNR